LAGLETQHEPGLVICLTGPESTGKTTLATQLAAELGVPLVAEAARAWLNARRPLGPPTPGGAGRPAIYTYTADDVLAIARAQLDAEQAALASGAPVVVADTDLTVIQVWWEEKYGALHPWLAEALTRRSARCYLLASADLPWEPDPLRESPHDRERLLLRYRAILAAGEFPHAEITGSGPIRRTRALAAVRQWIAASPRR